jgi:hypothetical protein
MKPILLFTILLTVSNLILAQSPVDTSHTFITKNLALNLDGAKHAYHPNNEGLLHNLNGGISQTEATANVFTEKTGYGIAKKSIGNTDKYRGYIQPNGYFVSQTSGYNKNKPDSLPEAYADAEVIPYITLSPGWKAKGVKNCDIAYVVNLDNGKESPAIFADYRNNDESVEISLALAKALFIPVYTKKGNSYDGKKVVTRYSGIKNERLKIYYFLKSGDGKGKTSKEIQQMAKKLVGKN